MSEIKCVSLNSLKLNAEWFDSVLLILGIEYSVLHVPSTIILVFSSSTSTVPPAKYVLPLVIRNQLCKEHAVRIILSVTSNRVEIGFWNIRNRLAFNRVCQKYLPQFGVL